MKERPIIFSGEMIQAILDGRKTMTRRPVKPQPTPHNGGWVWEPIGGMMAVASGKIYFSKIKSRCPYGQPGDGLWVRETFATTSESSATFNDCEYKADIRRKSMHKWTSPLFMPRWASRITLEIVNVRVERLQEITRSDIRAEGLIVPKEYCSDDLEYNYRQWLGDEFKRLWNSLYTKKPEFQWKANPWVWVVEFKI